MPRLRNGTLPDRQGIAATPRRIALTIASAAAQARAEDVVVLDLRKLSYSFDFFVLCTASSSRRLKTIAEEIQDNLRPLRSAKGHIEGKPEGGWVLLDCGGVIAHLFSSEAREFYGLERLWADAPRLPVPEKQRLAH